MKALSFTQPLITMIVFYSTSQAGRTYSVAALVMWLVFNIFPVKRLWGIKRDEALEVRPAPAPPLTVCSYCTAALSPPFPPPCPPPPSGSNGAST